MHAGARLMRQSAIWLMVVLSLGAFLRSAFVWIYTPRPFGWADLIHAHSHTAYFGWGGLALMGLMLTLLPSLTGAPVAAPGAVRWLLRLAPWAVGGALVTFAFEGYGPLSIAFATFNEVLWYLFAYIFWQSVKGRPVREWPPALWLMGTAVALLLLSTVGTLLVTLTTALPVYDPVLKGSGVYLFLQAYGDGWLEVGLMGVAAALLGGLPDRRLARWQAILLLALMVPASLRLLVPVGLEGWTVWVGVLSGLGLAVAQALFLVNIAPAWRRVPAAVRPWWGLAAAALLLKIALEALPLLPGWQAWAGERHLVIAYLHLKLLLLVTAGLIGALGVVTGRLGRGWALFASGAAAMTGALAAHGFLAGPYPALGRPLMAVAFGAAIVAAAGGMVAVWPVAAGRAGQAEGLPAAVHRQQAI